MDDYYWQDQRRNDMRMEQQRNDDLWKTQMLEQQRRDDLWKMQIREDQIREDQIQENQRREDDRRNDASKAMWNSVINQMTNPSRMANSYGITNSSNLPSSSTDTANVISWMWLLIQGILYVTFILYLFFGIVLR